MNNESKSKRLNRRHFLTAASAGAAAIGLSSAAGAKSGQDIRENDGYRPPARWRIKAERQEQMFGDGSSLPFFRYISVGNTRSNGALPLFRAFQGRNISLRIENLVDFPIQPKILDYATGPIIMPQEIGQWNFQMPPAGTWIFTEELLGAAASSAGFAAAMISYSSKQKLPEVEYFLLYQDADDRWNNAIDTGNIPDESVFEPNYHTVNGLSYPHTVMDDDTKITCNLGDEVLIRIANVSNIRHSLHFHGYHADLIRRNNVLETTLPEKDTFAIPANSTAEINLPVIQVGEYPVHPHSLTATTDNGTYQGGSVTMIDAQA